MLWACVACTTRFSPGSAACPHCGGLEYQLAPGLAVEPGAEVFTLPAQGAGVPAAAEPEPAPVEASPAAPAKPKAKAPKAEAPPVPEPDGDAPEPAAPIG